MLRTAYVLRMISPVRVGSRVRSIVVLTSAYEWSPGKILCNFAFTV